MALASLLGQAANGAPADPMAPRPPHFPGKAKSVIFLFMAGGPSQLELFDYKPKLAQYEATTPMGAGAWFGEIGDWQSICADAATVADGPAERARAFLEDRFSAYLVLDGALTVGWRAGGEIAEGTSDELKDRVGGERLDVTLHDEHEAADVLAWVERCSADEPAVARDVCRLLSIGAEPAGP